jgi:hypothetical protein
MLGGMQEDDGLIWTLYGTHSVARRVRKLRILRRQYVADLTDAEAEVMALRHRLSVIDNAISDYMLGDKQDGAE